ncbi:hypothetical protein [Sulfurifustis variabilis]|uniref:hypothetical protein n=1 Tax=Sulfurifustis variabilis TaxID=1675686 RepID=UPI00147440F0|nr:hypothetical protein [Sulfurifustis variabilis]
MIEDIWWMIALAWSTLGLLVALVLGRILRHSTTVPEEPPTRRRSARRSSAAG